MPTLTDVSSVPLPADSRLHQCLPSHDFADAWRGPAAAAALSPQAAYLAVFARPPHWVRALMRLRGHIVRRLGLRHDFDAPGAGPLPAADTPWPAGQRVAGFMVCDSTATELIVGEDDRHLDFRISLQCRHANGQGWVTLSTAVRTHNRLGRVYLALVKPFHRRIARSMVQRAVAAGWQ